MLVMLHCVRENQPPAAYQSLICQIISLSKLIFVTDFMVPSSKFIYILIMDNYKLWERKPRL